MTKILTDLFVGLAEIVGRDGVTTVVTHESCGMQDMSPVTDLVVSVDHDYVWFSFDDGRDLTIDETAIADVKTEYFLGYLIEVTIILRNDSKVVFSCDVENATGFIDDQIKIKFSTSLAKTTTLV